ncbi:sigma-70 family RNA polymerase sigma factor [Nocardia cyriacigeorgica]|uniref:Sigma-70 family RNA polymerase sigma factor n=1 Tax=Nocardia cyriacigeorgica TaxID=135487 RepID=A0ABX0CMX6_9NOCA|nr:ECF RNA polymerase sigma factor SigK [Nocardia cyriacigeorgica]NEW41337.1 sigma-70 family RNA polymerase sigma factor [Nocardia cyriacigeorgica]NEW52859.1 sigma-70 family RNA polymerase sigma factor [Nocardia cyriacigeorgica]NEW57406.1 sigma-70 family RNA polymerase sigma factor [Nocardia cyriacigeorgica]
MTSEPGPMPFIGRVAPDTAAEQGACPARNGNGDARRQLDGLLKSTAAGDREAFTRFYRETSPRVFGLALRVLRSPTAAEETTQEVYLQVWSTAERYDPALSSPIGWLMMITHRRAVDRVRSESSAAGRDAVYGHTHLGRDHDIVAETVGQRLEEQDVRDCLDTLTVTQREAVALAYYSGRTYREVADHLHSPLPTVKSRIRDGLKRLQDCLTGVARDD